MSAPDATAPSLSPASLDVPFERADQGFARRVLATVWAMLRRPSALGEAVLASNLAAAEAGEEATQALANRGMGFSLAVVLSAALMGAAQLIALGVSKMNLLEQAATATGEQATMLLDMARLGLVPGASEPKVLLFAHVVGTIGYVVLFAAPLLAVALPHLVGGPAHLLMRGVAIGTPVTFPMGMRTARYALAPLLLAAIPFIGVYAAVFAVLVTVPRYLAAAYGTGLFRSAWATGLTVLTVGSLLQTLLFAAASRWAPVALLNTVMP